MTSLSFVQYHPEPFSPQRRIAGTRKVRKRLNTILNRFDLTDSTVLDLGCSGGFFSFHLARHAKRVLAIDSDEGLIKRNRLICQKQGIFNLHFEHAVISPQYIQSLERHDVTLFLSVLHHIMAASNVYEVNRRINAGLEQSLELLRSVQTRTHSLVFEMGQTNEINEWVTALPQMGDSPHFWIVENLLQPARFGNIEIIEPPEWQGKVGMLRKAAHEHAQFLYTSRDLVSRTLRRTMALDTKDCRYMFIAQSGNR